MEVLLLLSQAKWITEWCLEVRKISISRFREWVICRIKWVQITETSILWCNNSLSFQEDKFQECKAWECLKILTTFHSNTSRCYKDKAQVAFLAREWDHRCRTTIGKVRNSSNSNWCHFLKNSKTPTRFSISSRCFSFLISRGKELIKWYLQEVRPTWSGKIPIKIAITNSSRFLLTEALIPNNSNFYSNNCKIAWMGNFSSRKTSYHSTSFSSSTRVLKCRIKTVTTEEFSKMYIPPQSMCPHFDNNRLLECNSHLPILFVLKFTWFWPYH